MIIVFRTIKLEKLVHDDKTAVCRTFSEKQKKQKDASIKKKVFDKMPCEICQKSFTDPQRLAKHILTHSDEKPYKCDSCSKCFRTETLVKMHISRMHTGQTKSFACDICALQLKSKGSLTIHRKRHLKEYIAECEYCKIGFVTNQGYINHMGSKHGPSNHVCNICGRACYDKAALLGHMARHAKDYGTNSNIKCDICNKTFLQEKYLKHHYLRMHENGGQRFICHLCGKKVNSKRSLRDHMYIHQGIKPLQCKECGKSFGLRTTLKMHMRTHTGQRPYECTYCGKSFTQRTPLTIHMRYHTGDRPYSCHLCDEKFVSGGVLNLHIKKVHGTNLLNSRKHNRRNPFNALSEKKVIWREDSVDDPAALVTDVQIKSITFLCQYCKKKFPTEEILCDHLDRLHSPQTPDSHFCTLCDKKFKTDKILKTHMKIIHTLPRTFYECCEYRYVSEERYNMHREKYHNDRFERITNCKYWCKFCNKIFRSYQNILDHVNTKHIKEKEYLCNVCSATFNSSTVLKRHLRKHDNSVEELDLRIVFECHLCKKEYPTQDSYEAHKRNNHTEHFDKLPDKGYQCKYCDKVVVAKVSMEEHLNAVHFRDAAYICEVCGKNCYSRASLIKHETSHIKERTFMCDICRKWFRHREALRKHMKTSHNTTPGWKCEICNEKFKTRKALSQHKDSYHQEDNVIFITQEEDNENTDQDGTVMETLIIAEDDGENIVYNDGERMDDDQEQGDASDEQAVTVFELFE